MKKPFLFALAGIVAVGIVALAVLSTGSTLEVNPPVAALGQETTVRVVIANPHGVRAVEAFIEQDGTRHKVFERRKSANWLGFIGKKEEPVDVLFKAGKKQAAGIKDGKAVLAIEATSNDFLGRTDAISIPVTVVSQPPRVVADTLQHYINQGGSELVVFTPSGYWTEAGVRVGQQTFRSYPLPGSTTGERFSVFAFSWDTPVTTVPVVFARNPTGTEAHAEFWYRIKPKPFRSRNLDVNDRFFEKVTGQIDPGGQGELLERFLKINRDFRHRDNQRLADLRLKTEERFLWSEPFVQLANSKVESLFADKRSYVYNGKKIDEQVHLGFDLSVTQGVAVTAANAGKVVWADDLGIYGNCIVLDHGYGVQSIYGHLSRIDVKAGDMVKRGQELGRSGSTGLAGGDHLHFSMQVDGVQVTPVEWWDEHWLKDRIWSKVPPPRT
jgi:murein DD-endopeptidase MepM/ murein hydrolase activator NlpD